MIATLFAAGSALVLPAWALLIVLPRWRGVAQAVAGLAVPALLALAYTVLVFVWWSRAEGGFASIADVRALFASDAVLTAGWFHYLAFDLLIGAWIVRQAQAEGIRHLAIAPLLPLTFLFGPVGYLAFLALRAAKRATDPADARPGPFSALRARWQAFAARDRVLVASGILFWLAMIPTGLAYLLDDRTIAGVPVWLKPLKFELSLGLFAFTLAYFMPMASAAFRRSLAGRFTVWGFVLPSIAEVAYIGWRASRAELSHFNNDSPVATLAYALMGTGAIVLTLSSLVLAYGVARRDAPPAEPVFRLAAILGLALTFVLGGLEGIAMSASGSHSVGAVASGDIGIPLFGWLRSAGDLRIAHFIGIHAQQAIPIVGALAVAFIPRNARAALIAFTLLYSALFAATFVQAMAGAPLLAMR